MYAIIKEFSLSKPAVVALGNFDGLHKGHMAIIKKAAAIAKERGISSCVYTFWHTPADLLSGVVTPVISTMEQTARILESCGIDCLAVQSFDDNLMRMQAEQFFYVNLQQRLKAAAVAVGYDYRFGFKASGDTALLQRLCGESGLTLYVQLPVMEGGEPVSSSRIRGLLAAGDIRGAQQMLGRRFSVGGVVTSGDKLGASIGAATANLPLNPMQCRLPDGVYATLTEVDGQLFRSVTNYGGKPTVREGYDGIESHLLDFSGDLYGKYIEVYFVEKIRDIVKFPSVEALMERIKLDIEFARDVNVD